MDKKTGVTGIILAGGKNKRMGMEKALLKVGPSFIIEHISNMLRKVVGEVLVVAQESEKYETYCDRVVRDLIPGHGPLGGLHAGLTHATHQRTLVTACDMPFVSSTLAVLMINKSIGYDAVVPIYHGLPEPLFTVYDKNCLAAIESLLNQDRNKITGFYQHVRVNRLEEKEMRLAEPNLEKVFFNINTPDDLHLAQSYFEGD